MDNEIGVIICAVLAVGILLRIVILIERKDEQRLEKERLNHEQKDKFF